MSERVTAEHLRSLQYFWEEKGDIERDSSWTELRQALVAQYPEIMKTWTDYRAAKVIFSAVLDRAVEQAERKERMT